MHLSILEEDNLSTKDKVFLIPLLSTGAALTIDQVYILKLVVFMVLNKYQKLRNITLFSDVP